MKIHFIQHVDFEEPGIIESWFKGQGDECTISSPYRNDPLPEPSDADLLVIMGGPMSVGDVQEFPWLIREKECIGTFIRAGKVLIGICLGAQLIAEALGESVFRGEYKEVGWFPVYSMKGESALLEIFPGEFPAFHWHGDTFGIPQNAVHLLSSKGCRNQAFSWEDRVFAFQFHLETTYESAELLIRHASGDLEPDIFVETPEAILGNQKAFREIHQLQFRVLEKIRSLAAESGRASS